MNLPLDLLSEVPTCIKVREFTSDNTTLIATMQALKAGLLLDEVNCLEGWLPKESVRTFFDNRSSLSHDLREIINDLPEKIASERDVKRQLSVLFEIITRSINRRSTIDEEVSRSMLRIMYPFVNMDVSTIFSKFSNESIGRIYAVDAGDYEDPVVKDTYFGIYNLSTISMGIEDVNVYIFLLRLLKHPHFSVRSASSSAIYNWTSNQIHKHYGEALSAWLDPNVPIDNSSASTILESLGKLRTKDALTELEKYVGTRLARLPLKFAILDCKGELHQAASRSRTRR